MIFKEFVHLVTRDSYRVIIVRVMANLALVVSRRSWLWCRSRRSRAGAGAVLGMVPQVLLQRVAIDGYLVRISFSGVADGARLVAWPRGRRGRRCLSRRGDGCCSPKGKSEYYPN